MSMIRATAAMKFPRTNMAFSDSLAPLPRGKETTLCLRSRGHRAIHAGSEFTKSSRAALKASGFSSMTKCPAPGISARPAPGM
jgi:hypothetical protein